MTPLPGALGDGSLVAWRIDQAAFAPTWASGEGAFQVGGRWNSRGVRAVYCSVDPATAILEVAVHKGFRLLDAQPHVLTCFTIAKPETVRVVTPDEIPNPNWLTPGAPSAGQQAFGDALLRDNAFVLIPSSVSRHSWNLIFIAARAEGGYGDIRQERLAIDTRLSPPPARR